MKIFATYNIKGGVGKTSAAVNLAHLAARSGYNALLWDLDPQGAATYLFRVRPKVKGGSRALVEGTRSLDDAIKATDFDGLDLVPADFRYRNLDVQLDDMRRPTRRIRELLRPLMSQYDTVFLDCPPSISLLSENVLHAADAIIVPLLPTPLSVRMLVQLQDFITAKGWTDLKLLPFFSMVDRRKSLHHDIIAKAREQFPTLLVTEVPYSSEIERMTLRRAPIPAFAPRSPAAQIYSALWAELTAALRLAGSTPPALVTG